MDVPQTLPPHAKRTINGREYIVFQMPGPWVLDAFHDSFDHIATILGAAQSLNVDFDQTQVTAIKAIAAGGEKAARVFADPKFKAMTKTMLGRATCDGVDLSKIPDHWQTRLADYMPLVWLALEANFGALFGGGAGEIPSLKDVVSAVESLLSSTSDGSAPSSSQKESPPQ